MSAMPLPLRRRVTLALTLLGVLLSLLFAAAATWVTEDYEHVLATEILRGQAEDYGLRLANGLPALLPKTHRLSGYTRTNVPAQYAGLEAGVHEEGTEDGVHVGVFDTSAGRLWFVINLGDIEILETHLNWMLAGVVVFGTLLAGLLGWYFAGAALMPLRRLAQAVDAMPVEPRVTNLRAQASNDELGQLAGAIDDYQRRLVEADAHEQAFFADASHELRTPIAVVQGATEVMLDDVAAESDPRRIERLHRLDRGVREMSGLIDMLLVVARRRPLQIERVDTATFLRETIEPLRTQASRPEVEIVADGTLQLPRREALLLLRHAIDKLGWPASGDTLRMQFDGRRLDMSTHARQDTPTATQCSDAGGAGALSLRLASQLGWRFLAASPGHLLLELPTTAHGDTTQTE
ncbi:HAMP domain-containing sensor histidine kinase [Thermomonas sp. HDW16]|uniref:sensor histidine kinase n=1 Tax=Thermomonas sp. HDW16 TaxID=2714945 RepID=UPI00140D5F7A|nr:HAMP domain-containing sensor histidine kinase [Thermomonas sp. HDW16]QIL19575.1 HAMP domain-containing histidine kinase [Thermomonas sp. HDW16]